MEDVWVEKYRPKNLDEVVAQDMIVARLKAYVREKTMPHLIFAGPPGTGKTTCAINLAKGLFQEDWRGSFHELNASDERGIDVVRHQIKEYARTAPSNNVGFKIIFLDEADNLTSDAQAALRRTMEKYSRTCRFILSVNYSSKIIDPIQSRCGIFRFKSISSEDMKKRLKTIAQAENKTLDEKALDSIIYISMGDLRKAINILQTTAVLSEKIDENSVYFATGLATRKEMEELINIALKGSFEEARSLLDKLIVERGMPGEDVVREMHRVSILLPIKDELKVKLIEKIGDVEFKIVEGANDRIQLDSLIAYITLLGKEI